MYEIKKLLNIDWLSISYLAELSWREQENELILKETKDYQLEKVKGTNVFKSRYYVLSQNGNKKMTILCDPISNILAKNLMLVEFANHTLYNEEYIELFSVLKKIHQGEINGISRLDVCCDFQYCEDYFGKIVHPNTFLKEITSNMIYIQGKKERAIFEEMNIGKGNFIENTPKQISFGSKTSDIKWKIYNKSKELKEVSDKEYIRKQWNEIKFDETEDIYRCEVSITNCNRYAICDENENNFLFFTELKNKINDIFATMYNQKFTIRANDGNNNRNRNKKINFLKIEENNLVLKKKESTEDYLTDQAKTLINVLIKNYSEKVTGHNNEIADKIYELITATIKTYHLLEWFEEKYEITLDDLYFFNFEKRDKRNFNEFLQQN